MANNLGNSTTPATGYFYDISGNSQFASGAFVMPAGGGTVTDLYVYVGGYGAATSGQLVIWDWAGPLIWQSGTITIPAGSTSLGGQGWVHVTVPNVYIATGNLGFGFWAAGSVIWTFESSGATDYQHGLSGPATLAPPGTDGTGALGAYITYTPGGIAEINTGTPASPAFTQGVAYVNTGTQASPVWTPCNGLEVNNGTPASPNWVNGA